MSELKALTAGILHGIATCCLVKSLALGSASDALCGILCVLLSYSMFGPFHEL